MKRSVTNLILWIIIVFPLLSTDLQAQSKARVRLSLDYFRIPQMEYLTVGVRGRLDRRYEPIENIGVSFYLGKQSEETYLGKIVTDASGSGRLDLPDHYYITTDTLQELDFVAVLDSSPTYQDATEELKIRKVRMELTYIDMDSIKQVKTTISEKDSTGQNIPQDGVTVKYYIERPLGNLPIGEELNRTNEKGNVNIDFPTDIPGDPEGNVKLIVRIEDNDKYGNIEKTDVLKWGVPTEIDPQQVRRSLWSSGANAPISLLILVNSLILAVWGTIFYIILKIFKISRI